LRTLSLYLFFHLNLAYSSITEEQRPKVIKKCYWPLLQLAEHCNICVGLEASGYSLEQIYKIDPNWILKLKKLCADKKVKFIGSGYTQAISPLIPAIVNKKNLELGLHTYKKLLDLTPRIALVNEQAWSRGIVNNYLDAGYKTVIMEWDNPARNHPSWNPLLKYFPQYAQGTGEERIQLLWNHSISFQKLQRYIHGELSIDSYIDYLQNQIGETHRFFSLYGNDTEIFNFRPGRFHTEAKETKGEWDKFQHIINLLQSKQEIQFVALSDILKCPTHEFSWNTLDLSCAKQPIPVKKQGKYNITRWAVTGRNDTHFNSDCYAIFYAILNNRFTDPDRYWKKICYYWSSDFRTHITSARYHTAIKNLADDLKRIDIAPICSQKHSNANRLRTCKIAIRDLKRYIEISSSDLFIRLDKEKGLCIESLVLSEISQLPIAGTLPHGFFDNISYGTDFFTGHMILTLPGFPQITDLQPVVPEIHRSFNHITLYANITLLQGTLKKTITIDAKKKSITTHYKITVPQKPYGTLRLGYLTCNPECFNDNSLFFRTHNGGMELESFILDSDEINHFSPISPIVSSGHCLGETEGFLDIGDAEKFIRLSTDKTLSSGVGGIYYTQVGNSYLLRHMYSLLEIDDTNIAAYHCRKNNKSFSFTFSFTISGCKI